MPGNHIHGNGLPAAFVPGQRHVYEGYWAADESKKKKSVASLFHCFLRPAGADPGLDHLQKYFFDSLCFLEWTWPF